MGILTIRMYEKRPMQYCPFIIVTSKGVCIMERKVAIVTGGTGGTGSATI